MYRKVLKTIKTPEGRKRFPGDLYLVVYETYQALCRRIRGEEVEFGFLSITITDPNEILQHARQLNYRIRNRDRDYS